MIFKTITERNDMIIRLHNLASALENEAEKERINPHECGLVDKRGSRIDCGAAALDVRRAIVGLANVRS